MRCTNSYALKTELVESSGVADVDDFLFAMVNILALGVGERLRSIFLIGSYADGSYAPGSDIDCCFIWKAGTDEATIRRGTSLRDHLCAAAGRWVDPMWNGTERPFYDERTVEFPCGPILRTAVRERSRLLWGDDIRSRIPPPRQEDMLADVLAAPLNWIRQYHYGSLDAPISHPLTDPAPDRPDRGYSKPHKMPLFAIHIARALVFLETGEFLFDKRLVPDALAATGSAEWAGRLRDLANARYQALSDAERGQQCLKTCKWITAFQNRFLEVLMARGIDLSGRGKGESSNQSEEAAHG